MSIQSGTSPGAIISAGVSPVDGVSSVFGRTGAVVAVAGDYDSDQIDNASGVAGATVSDALDQLDSDIAGLTSDDIANSSSVPGATVTTALDAAGTYYWVWADAAERQAEVVTAAQVGAVGYQTDIAREYKLLALSGGNPNSWGELADSKLGPLHQVIAQAGATSWDRLGTPTLSTSGTPTGVVPGTTTRSLSLIRTALVSTTGAGSVAIFRFTSTQTLPMQQGARWIFRFVLGTLSTNMRWFVGITTTTITTNIDPGTLTNSIGIGRSTESNVQAYWNDGAGAASTLDLGASFPATTTNTGYELQIWSVDGISYVYQLRNLDTNVEFSATLSSNIPAASTLFKIALYISNNTDVSAVSIDIADIMYGQVTR